VLREDNRAILRATSAASKAADWLLARARPAEEAEGADEGAREAAPPRPGGAPKGGRVAP
jgi:antirestriction protein ArdC